MINLKHPVLFRIIHVRFSTEFIYEINPILIITNEICIISEQHYKSFIIMNNEYTLLGNVLTLTYIFMHKIVS